jgi:hypothetical protein
MWAGIMSIDVVLNRLKRVRRTGPETWSALCPAHGDRHPSLGLRQTGEGSILIKCRANCETFDVLAAIGLSWSDLYAKPLADRVAPQRPQFPASALLALLNNEANIASVAADNLANGIPLTAEDRNRLRLASIRISRAWEVASGR